MAPRVAVIGAGPVGLMAVKNFKEDGFDVKCFEARPYIGGLWRYSDDAPLSVAERTIFNSSKYRPAIPDYPFPEDTDDFPTWRQMGKYLAGYADEFHLRPHIQLDSRVTRLSREGKKWVVEVAPDREDGNPRREYFDKVAVAIGTYVTPKWPRLDGIEKFAGRTMHAIDFHRPETFKDQKVLIVGIFSSAQDVAVGLSGHAKQTYASHRNGVVLTSRYNPSSGGTFDQSMTVGFCLFQMFMMTWFPNLFNWLADKIFASLSKRSFPNVPKSLNSLPAPSIATTPPLIGDEIYHLVESGFCEPVPAISRITGPKSIELTGGRVLEDIDAIIYCTGYDMATPFVEREHNPYPVPGGPSYLYRGTFPLHEDPDVRNSLAFLGHGIFPIPGFVQLELMIWTVSQIWQGNSHLPSLDEMRAWHRRYLAWRDDLIRKQRVPATFYVAIMPFADHVRWFEDASGSDVFSHFGMFSWKSWVLWWSDRRMYRLYKSGLFSPAIWRLFETGKRKAWKGAREQILKDNEAAQKQRQTRLENKKTR